LEQALLLQVNGWVMNLPDGNVALHAEGESEAIDRLLSWCHKGSPQSEVAEVIHEPAAFMSYSDFQIKR
jgi:acylphosphatase